MAKRQILLYPASNLFRKTLHVERIDKEIKKLINDLKDTLYSTTGIGLASTQIGSNKSVFIYDPFREEGKRNCKILINPSVVSQEGEILSESEGCKSFPGLRVDVKRAAKIHVEGLDETGTPINIVAEGFEATVLQHEIDHVNGVLMIDHVPDDEKEQYKWYAQNLVNIAKRLKWLENKPEGMIYRQRTALQNVFVFKVGTQIQLYFADQNDNSKEPRLSGIMSRIDLRDPLYLLGIYTQAMMLSLIWNSHPKRAFMLGFGGGRIPMVLNHYCSELVIDGVDIDPDVIGITSRYFGVEPGKRLNVVVEDGRSFLLKCSPDITYDIILVDCYTGSGQHPYSLSTIEFYGLCKQHLTDNGVVATNLIESDPLYQKKVQTLRVAFKIVYDFHYEGAHVFFCTNGERITPQDFLNRANLIHKKYKFNFPFIERAQVVTILPFSLSNIEVLTDASAPLQAQIPKTEPTASVLASPQKNSRRKRRRH